MRTRNLLYLFLILLMFSACSDYSGNENDVEASLTPFVCDNSSIELATVTTISSDNDSTPDFTLSSTHSGTLNIYGDSCSTSTVTVEEGNNTITLSELSPDTYTCKLSVTNSSMCRESDNLSFSFSVAEVAVVVCDSSDTTAPTLTETTRVGVSFDNNTNDTTPDYIFTSNEASTLTYGGSCKGNNDNSADNGSNSITLVTSSGSAFSHGSYSDCTIQATDCNGNKSDNLSISPFSVYKREELFSVTYGNGTFVAVGDSGRILTSSSGDNNSWSVQTSGTTSDLYDIGTDNTTFVAVGYRGKLIRSVDNGTTWSTPSTWGQSSISGTTTDIKAVAGQIDNVSGNNDFVIVTDSTSGKIGFSTDNGSTWSSGVAFASSDLAYGDDVYVGKELFVAVGSDGDLQQSETNGQSWTLSSISAQDLNGISFGSGSNIVNTTGIGTVFDNFSVAKTGIATVNNITDRDNHTNGSYNSVSFSGGSGSDSTGTVTVSGNNVTNISITTAGYGYKVGDNLSIDNDTIGGTDDAYFLVASTSYDDLTEGNYTNVSLTSSSGSGAKATIVITSDNISSITITDVGTGFLMGDNITINNSNTNSNFPGSVELWVKTLYSYQTNWGIFAIVANAGVVLYSTDNGSTWNTGTNNDTTTDLYSVAYGNGKFIAAGYSNMNSSNHGGVVIVSNDNASNWSLKTSDYVFDDITYGKSKFIAVQQRQYVSGYGWKYERIFSSTDGENWTLVHDPNY